MGKSLDWVREEPNTGRLLYRRSYPERLRPFLPAPRQGHRELKVPLKARRVMTVEAFRLYDRAKRLFEEDVRQATAAAELERKTASDTFDVLTPELIAYLVEAWTAEGLALDDAVRWLDRPRDIKLRAHQTIGNEVRRDLDEALQLRGLGDLAAIVDVWGDAAARFAEGEGIRVDCSAPTFLDYVRALHDAQIATWEAILRRLTGEDVPTPEVPTRPQPAAAAVASEPTVHKLLEAYQAAKWDGWSPSTRKANTPVMRLLRDTIGDREVRSISREAAREVLAIVRTLPAGLGRRKELEGLTVPAAVEAGKLLGLPTIAPGTINKGYMVNISAVFQWALKEEWADRNPFTGLGVVDPVAPEDKRDPFTLPQLQTLFGAAPWASPQAPEALDKPGRYWVPLIALFTGMRLAEVAGLPGPRQRRLPGRSRCLWTR